MFEISFCHQVTLLFDDYSSKTRSTEDLLAFYGLHKPLKAYLSAVGDPQLTLDDVNNAYWGADVKTAKNKILSRALLHYQRKNYVSMAFYGGCKRKDSTKSKKGTNSK